METTKMNISIIETFKENKDNKIKMYEYVRNIL